MTTKAFIVKLDTPGLVSNLAILHKFMVSNGIKYVLTGTAAIRILGLPTDVGDIDVIVDPKSLSQDQKEKLKELQELSGLRNPEYGGVVKCISFFVQDVKVNVLLSECPVSFSIILDESFGFTSSNDSYPIIKIQPLVYALKAKMHLGRPKDKQFMLDAINLLVNLK